VTATHGVARPGTARAAHKLPTISFVVAAYNEEAAIGECVRSLLAQDYPAERIEVAVVDGGSTDRTREIVAAIAAVDPRVKLLANPARIAASAFNIGVAATTGELISLASAHSRTDPDYAAVLADAFRMSGAALVGGSDNALPGGPGAMAQAIARAASSPLGLGSAKAHYSSQPGWIDTAHPGAYRRELFAEIGGFDESLVRNQDDELHLRARLAGHRMWFEPRLHSRCQTRATLRALWRQYFQYGWWRAITVHKHRRVASARHLAPAALVAGLAAGPVLAAAAGGRRRLLLGLWAGGAGAWAGLLALAGWRERGAPPGVARRVPVAVAYLHLAYGTGFWNGVAHLVRRSLRRQQGPARPPRRSGGHRAASDRAPDEQGGVTKGPQARRRRASAFVQSG
jgi:succinoglycan biosynthesis protein ExoA